MTMTPADTATTIMFAIYLVAMLLIGWLGYRATSNLSDYILGGRSLGSFVTALSAGASGFLLKDADPQAVVDAVRTVHEGQSLLSPQILRGLVSRSPSGAACGRRADDVGRLTPRQREVLVLIARGLSNGEIETVLGITRATCRSHITALLARLDARDRAQLVIAAYEAGLVQPGA